MSKRHLIQVFEHEKLKYGGHPRFTKVHFEALSLFNEKHQNKYFTIIHKGVQFKQFVGVIQVNGLTIEILPKVDKNTKTSNEDKQLWRDVLLNMLRVCKKIKVAHISEAGLKKRRHSILEIYYELYLNEVKALIKRGLIKKYRTHQSNQKALKGKLMFHKNIQKNLIHNERFYCAHQVYDRNHLIHHILFKALKVLDSLVSPRLRDKLNRVLFEMQEYKEIPINAQHFSRIKLNRKTQVYSDALEIAKMLILNYSPSISAGKDKMITLLFDMNKLWEDYIYRVLLGHKPSGFKVEGQQSKKFWENKRIKPDIVVTDLSKDKKLIIDTKWKVVEQDQPSDDDLKQMFSYNLLWKSEKSILLYPKVNQTASNAGEYTFRPVNNGSLKRMPNTCELVFIDILGSNGMKSNREIASEVFGNMGAFHLS